MLRNQDPSPYKEIDIKGMEKELERKWNWKRNGYGAHKKKPIWSHNWTM
jgi:hypothetical protein